MLGLPRPQTLQARRGGTEVHLCGPGIAGRITLCRAVVGGVNVDTVLLSAARVGRPHGAAVQSAGPGGSHPRAPAVEGRSGV